MPPPSSSDASSVRLRFSIQPSTLPDCASFAAVTSSNDNEIFVGRIDLAKLDPDTQRYLFARAVGDGANAQVYGVSFVALNAKYKPVTQDNTVAFSV